MSMYLRLKRKNQTVFMHVEPSDSFASIKQRIAELFDEVDATGIMLLNTDKVLPFELMLLTTLVECKAINADLLW